MTKSLWFALFFALLCGACVQEQMQLTEPCVENCNAQAVLGSPCAAAQDCPQDVFCNLTFPGGYCQVACTSTGEACGPNEDGVCLPNSGGEIQALCLGGCDVSAPASCPNPAAVCYPNATGGPGICGLRCGSDSDCEQGQACDGQGLCRVVDNQCNGLTDGGCQGQGLRCYLSSAGTFCGLPGAADLGQACGGTVASCAGGLWCIEGLCRTRCDVDDFTACGGIPALCSPLARGARLGFCDR